MVNHLRLVIAAIIAFMVIAVDFTSKLLSILSDGMLVAGLIVVLWPLINPSAKKDASQ